MKKIAIMLVILIVALVVWGTVIIAYANAPRTTQVQLQPGAAATLTQVEAQPTQPPVKQNALPPGTVISQGNSNKPEIALTFDDGPNPTYTPQVLNILQRHGIHATFFCIGEQVQSYPNLVQQEYAAGNVVGNHTWDHPDLTTRSAHKIYAELDDASTAIQQTTGVWPTFFRPPYGAINNEVKRQASQLGLTPTLWSIDTKDWQLPGTSVIVNRVLSQSTNGSIILMHDGGGFRSQTVAALPTIITGLEQRGFQLVTIQQIANDLLQSNASPANVVLAFPDLLSLLTAMIAIKPEAQPVIM